MKTTRRPSGEKRGSDSVRVEEIKLGDRVRVAFQETSDPQIKLPVFELAGR